MGLDFLARSTWH